MWTPIQSSRLHVIRFPEVITGASIAGLLKAVADGRAAPDFDVLTDYSAVKRVDMEMCELVRLATARRAALPDMSAEIRSAAVCTGEAARDFVETWTTFFEEENRAIRTEVFSRVEPAIAWLGRESAREAIFDALHPDNPLLQLRVWRDERIHLDKI